MTDTSFTLTSPLLPIGPSMIGAGWSTVLTYPSLQTNWVFWQSPNNQYWGPSSRRGERSSEGMTYPQDSCVI